MSVRHAADLDHAADSNALLRRGVYWLLIALGVGGMLGRILAVNAVDNIRLEQRLQKEGRADYQITRPFLSGNDRSRWCTVRSLVEHGTYQIDEIVRQPNWDTIDMVKHDEHGNAAPEADAGHMYSSKPPLLATILAGEYWVIHKLTGKTLGTHPYSIGRFMLVTCNLLPLGIYFWIMSRLIDRLGISDWGRIFVMAAATGGTLLTTFAVVLNNHLPAAVSAAIALYAAVRILFDDDRRWWQFALAGFFGAFAAACDLPALSFFALLGAILLVRAPRGTLLCFVPAAAIVVSAFFATNYLAHHRLKPPYAFREDANPNDNWYKYDYRDRKGNVRQSYWTVREKRSPIDQGEPTIKLYALHALVGHHGILSLTPVWLLSLGGMGIWLARGDAKQRALAAAVALVTVVCVSYYLTMEQGDRNYGGMSSGFRWVFWFAPLWLTTMIPAADLAGNNRWSRALCYLLLAFSALSVTYPTWNPWTNPWILDFLLSQDWVGLGDR